MESFCLQTKLTMRIFLGFALALAWANQAFAIYPDDHWNYSTRLTEENFDSFIQEGIDSGKTVVRSSTYQIVYYGSPTRTHAPLFQQFVRWIASSG